jgi:hypothetical protein
LKCSTLFSPKRSDGKYCSSKCRSCAGQKRFRARQPVEVRAQWRKYFYTERGTITALLNNASDRAKRAGLPFALDRDWLNHAYEECLDQANYLKRSIMEIDGGA